MPSSPSHIAILGGGVAGLAAAYRYGQLAPGSEIRVLEGDDHVGGLASAWKRDGFRADLGPHRIFTELPEIEALLPEIIEQGTLITVQRRSRMLLAGHYFDYPLRATELLKVLGPVRMARLALSAAQGKVSGLFQSAASFEDVMVHAFGRGLYSLVVEPYARKVWKTEPANLDAEVARVRVSAGNVGKLIRQVLGRPEKKGEETALREFRYVRGGVEGLVHGLQARAESVGAAISTRATVQGFELGPGATAGTQRVTHVCHGSSNDTMERVVVDSAISTLPLPDLAGMLAGKVPGAPQDALSDLHYLGLILVAVVVDQTRLSDDCWLYFPGEDLIFNRCYEPGNFDPSMTPDGRTMVVFEVTARWDSELWQSSDQSIIERVRADVVRAGLVSPGGISDAFAVRVPHTYPLYTTGYRERLKSALQWLSQVENLISTGRQGLYNHNNMDHSMLMGMRAAECLTNHPEQSAKHWLSYLDEFDRFRIVD